MSYRAAAARVVFGLLIFLLQPIQTSFAQTCNPPSGWLTQNGQASIGDAMIFGPQCGQVQSAQQGFSQLTTTILGNPATFYSPTFFGNAGTGVVSNMNRLKVGAAALVSNDILSGPPQIPSVPGWIDSAFQTAIVGNSQLSAGSAIGTLGITGYSRCSDFFTAFGGQSGGCQGVTGIGWGDASAGSISCGVCGIAVRTNGSGTVSINQMDANNAGTIVDITPFGGITNSQTIANLITSGAFSTISTANNTAGWVVGRGRPGGPQHRKGGLCLDGALDTALGAFGDGICMEMARNQSVRWLNSGGTTDGEITANATGLHANPGFPSIIPLTSGPGIAIPQASTRFFVNVQDNGGGEGSVLALCPRSGTFRNLFVQTNGNVGGAAQTAVFTWRVNAGATAITCTINSGSNSCNDQTHSVACTPGQPYDLQSVTSATTGSIIVGAGIEFDAQ